MKIIPIHYTLSRPVKKYSDIKSIVDEMIPFVDEGIKKGEYSKAHAIAHCQVSEDPYAFFVVNSQGVIDGMWPASVVINPEILEANSTIVVGEDENGLPDRRENIVEYEEGCFSFPFRKPKKVHRCFEIRVRYKIPGKFGRMKTITETIDGLKAHIFQHEYQHCLGQNIHFTK